MELAGGTAGEDELKTLAVLQSALHNQVTSNRVVLETLEHLTREKLQVKFTGIGATIKGARASKLSLRTRRVSIICLMCH